MKGGQNLRDLQAKKKEENSIPLVNCMVCNKEIQGYYARYGDSGVCGRGCMKHQETMERFPGHSAEDFERTMK